MSSSTDRNASARAPKANPASHRNATRNRVTARTATAFRSGDPSPSDSPLAARTIERGAAALDDAPDAPGELYVAGAPRARLAFAVVNGEAVLKIPEFAGGLAVVAQRRPAGGDRIGEHRDDRGGELHRAAALDTTRNAPRRKPGAEQRFAHINVAEPCHQPLVEERRLDRGPPSLEGKGEP